MLTASGIAVQAASGASRASLTRAVKVALRAWPAVERAEGVGERAMMMAPA